MVDISSIRRNISSELLCALLLVVSVILITGAQRLMHNWRSAALKERIESAVNTTCSVTNAIETSEGFVLWWKCEGAYSGEYCTNLSELRELLKQ